MRGTALRAALVLLWMGAAVAQPAPSDDDSRLALSLTPAERTYVLGQMRLFVESIQAIATGLADGQRARAVEVAAARGLKRNAADPAFPSTLGAKLPADWKQLGGALRRGFDGLAQGMAEGEGPQQSLARLGDVMKNCVACHATYRIVAERD
jgi:hypothetical protein